jgi:hypothetical protein
VFQEVQCLAQPFSIDSLCLREFFDHILRPGRLEESATLQACRKELSDDVADKQPEDDVMFNFDDGNEMLASARW